ncbi:MAG TPA: glycerol acyltransferase, partial [Phaeodactylibacter sp.]|nr:glycerol acyltransferase [Phaeodactylibacter sp.]
MEKQTTDLNLYTDEDVQQAIKELFSHEKFVTGMQGFLPRALSHHI